MKDTQKKSNLSKKQRDVIVAVIVNAVSLLTVIAWLRSGMSADVDSTQQWFSKNAEALDHFIKEGDDAGLDALLHHASQWHYMDAQQWTAFAMHHTRMLLGSPAGAVDNRTLDVLELGCGTGGYIRAARRHWLPRARFTGIDLNLESIAIARRVVPDATFLLGDLRDMRFLRDASFDAVVAPGSIGYVRDLRDVRHALREVVRVLRPGGVFMASVFGLPGDEGRLGSFRITATKEWWPEAAPGLSGWKFEGMTGWDGCNCEHRQRHRYAVAARRDDRN